MSSKTTEDLKAEINDLYAELRKLEVFPKPINFIKASDEDLETELEAVGDQLKTRKRFLGVK